LRRINKQTKNRLLSFVGLGFMRWMRALEARCPCPELNAPATTSLPKDTEQDGVTPQGLMGSSRVALSRSHTT